MAHPDVDYKPTYSHGGVSVDSWPAVPGTTVSSGRPVMTYGAIMCPAMSICCNGGGATVLVQANCGTLDDDGNPPAAEWMTIATYTMTDGVPEWPTLPYAGPVYRTKITAIDAATTVTSSVPFIIDKHWQVHPAKYPTIQKGAVR